MTPVYASVPRANARLNGRSSQPKAASMPRCSRSFGAPCYLSSSADSAGDRVSELTAEMTVLMAIVSANCR